MRNTLCRVLLALAILSAGACDQSDQAGDITAVPGQRANPVLTTAEDSAAALQQTAFGGTVGPLSSGVVEIRKGDKAVVTVISASTGRCEAVSVTGAITADLFSQVGTCNGVPYSYGVGQSVTIGPSPVDGTLTFLLPLTRNGMGASRVSGTYPNYTVELDDAMYDFDFNDVVLSVEILDPCAPPGRQTQAGTTDTTNNPACQLRGCPATQTGQWSFKWNGHVFYTVGTIERLKVLRSWPWGEATYRLPPGPVTSTDGKAVYYSGIVRAKCYGYTTPRGGFEGVINLQWESGDISELNKG